MPGLFRKDPEDAPDRGPASAPSAKSALPPNTLTQELLDWLLAALEAVIRTPQLQELASKRVRSAMLDAYLLADFLYPHTLEVKYRTQLWELENRETGVKLSAIEEGLLAQDHLLEHQDGDEARQAAEAGGSHRHADGREEQDAQDHAQDHEEG